jgi:hypothetical protein
LKRKETHLVIRGIGPKGRQRLKRRKELLKNIFRMKKDRKHTFDDKNGL